jgi:hypothetical protein
MDYGNILSRAWQLTWKHKILWLFGILAGSSGGNLNFGFNGRGATPTTTPAQPNGPFNIPTDAQGPLTAALIVIACVAVIVVLALVILSTIARGALIGGIRQADEQEHVTFREAWSIGTHYFWRMLGIALALLIPLILVAIVFGSILLFTFGLGFICLIPLICLLVPLFIVLVIVAHFAQFAVVLEDMAVVDAFRRGWHILASNVLPIVILGLILVVAEIVASLLLALPVLLIVLPTVLSALNGSSGPNNFALLATALGCLCYLPILLVLSGILHTWTTAAWTLAYKHFMGPPALPTMAPAAPPPAAPTFPA